MESSSDSSLFELLSKIFGNRKKAAIISPTTRMAIMTMIMIDFLTFGVWVVAVGAGVAAIGAAVGEGVGSGVGAEDGSGTGVGSGTEVIAGSGAGVMVGSGVGVGMGAALPPRVSLFMAQL